MTVTTDHYVSEFWVAYAAGEIELSPLFHAKDIAQAKANPYTEHYETITMKQWMEMSDADHLRIINEVLGGAAKRLRFPVVSEAARGMTYGKQRSSR
jgi:hypothetical protein